MQWKSIPFSNYSVSEYGDVRNDVTNTILWPHLHHDDYLRVQLVIKNKKTNKKIHILVAKAFKRNPKKLGIVNHLDGDKLNNHKSNLQYTTVSGNTKHAVKMGFINMAWVSSHRRCFKKESNELGQTIRRA